MSSRNEDKHWEQEGDEYRLYAPLFDYDEEDRCLAILKKDGANVEKNHDYIWVVMDFEDNYAEPSEIRSWNAEGYEEFETVEEAKLRVEECIQNRIESAIDSLEEIQQLFEM